MDLEEINCNLCGGTRRDQIFDLNPLKLVRCQDCGLKYVSPRYTESKVQKLYGDRYFTNSDFYSGDSSTLYGYSNYTEDRDNIEKGYRKIVRKMEKFIKLGNLLEVGSAYGYFLSQAKRKGWEVSGIELSESARAACEEEFGIKLFSDPVNEFKPVHKFDSVVSLDVLEHLHDPAKTLNTINGMIKPGGLLVLVVPNSASWVLRVLGRRWEDLQRVNSGEHLFFFDSKSLRQILEKAGFEILEIETIGRHFSLEQLCNRLQIYNKFIFSSLGNIVEHLGLKERTIYVNPLLKLIAFSRKVK